MSKTLDDFTNILAAFLATVAAMQKSTKVFPNSAQQLSDMTRTDRYKPSIYQGFLLGDRRGVKQCNAILDDHLQTFLKGMMDDKPLSSPNLDSDEDRPAAPTVH